MKNFIGEQPELMQSKSTEEVATSGGKEIATKGANTNELSSTLSSEFNVMDDSMQENGSPFGKFKTASDLLTAYNNLQAEFTRRCQALNELKRQVNTSLGEKQQGSKVSQNLSIDNKEKEQTDLNNANTQANECCKEGSDDNGVLEENPKTLKNIATSGEEENATTSTNSAQSNQITHQKEQNGELAHNNLTMYDTADREQVPTYQQADFDVQLDKFLSENNNAKNYAKEIGEEMIADKTLSLQSAYERVLVKQFKSPSELANDDEFITNYILNSEKVLKSIIKDYKNRQEDVPKIITSQKGTMAQALPSQVKTIKEAGELAYRLFD